MCYSTKLSKNTHVQAYLGRKILVDPKTILPASYKVPGEENQILLPYKKLSEENSEEEESFKLLSELVLHNKASGYTCFINSFALFISDKEINTAKSKVIEKLTSACSVDTFKALQLPILNET